MKIFDLKKEKEVNEGILLLIKTTLMEIQDIKKYCVSKCDIHSYSLYDKGKRWYNMDNNFICNYKLDDNTIRFTFYKKELFEKFKTRIQYIENILKSKNKKFEIEVFLQ